MLRAVSLTHSAVPSIRVTRGRGAGPILAEIGGSGIPVLISICPAPWAVASCELPAASKQQLCGDKSRFGLSIGTL